METPKEIEDKIQNLKETIRMLGRKKDLVTKNNRYLNDPEYRAKIMKRNRDYYQNKIRPTKVFKYKKCELKNCAENP